MKYFKLEEFIFSQTAIRHGINNYPSEAIIENIQWLCTKILDPLRERIRAPLYITSGYRCKELNKLVKGSDNSQHMEGKAVDIVCNTFTPKQLYNFILYNTKFPYDQIINEFNSWVHISYNRDIEVQRGMSIVL